MSIIFKIIKKLRNSILKARIQSKINIFYILVLFFSLITSYLLYNALHNKIVEDKVSSTSIQTLKALDKNLEFILGDVSQFSNLIFFDKGVQQALRQVNAEGMDVNIQGTLNKYLANMLLSNEYISSVYMFDNYNNKYSMGKQLLKSMVYKRIEEAPWYENVIKLQGDLLWIPNSGGVLQQAEGEKYVSLVRVINDINTMKKLGTLLVNVEESSIQKGFEEIGKTYKSQFFIMDEKGKYIVQPLEKDRTYESYLIPQLYQKQGYVVKTIGNTKTLICFITSKYSNWKIVGVLPISEMSREMSALGYISIFIILMNSFFISMGTIYITKLVTKPLIQMQRYMKKAEQGDFQTMEIEKNREDEIVQLKKGFNKMVVEIENLIDTVKKEEKTIRKNELNLIHAQIHPHFLYNTLDAISALALLKDHESVFTMTQSLGNFYRTSLSNGQEMVTVEEEIKCIQNYITILDIRYKGKFEVFYEIQEEIKECKILKLILQPIVENAIHHGLRNKYGKGRIDIRGYKEKDMLFFKVKDDGIGMDEKKIEEIITNKSRTQKNSFGIFSTMERISIFYNIDSPLEIESKEMSGTEVTLCIPIAKEWDYEKN